jgi:hypothetical protein
VEITFQNKREDLQSFYDYVIGQTEEGRVLSSQAYRSRQIWTFFAAILIGSFAWGTTGQWKSGLSLAIVILLVTEALIFLISGFKPRYHEGIQFYKRWEKSMTARELQLLQLPKIMYVDDNWLEMRNTEALHRYRWRSVDRISLTPNFIFIHIGTWPVIYIPKRDFPFEESFVEFGKRLVELRERNKDQPIGLE